MKSTKPIAACAFFLLAPTYSWAQESNFFTPAGREVTRASRSASDGRVTRSRLAGVHLETLGESAKLNLFQGAEYTANRHRSYVSPTGDGTIWSGAIADDDGSDVMLAVRNGMVTGSIRTGSGQFFRIRPQQDGAHLIEELDPHLVPIDDETVDPEPNLLQAESGKSDGVRAGLTESRDAINSVIDLLVVYTPEARAAQGGTAQIQNLINLAVAEANQSFVNSGINISMRLVHTAEAAPSSGQAASSTYLAAVRNNAAIQQLRNQYGADMVSAWVNGPGASGGTVGIGYVMTSPSTSFAPAAYSVVEVNFAPGPSYSFTHECGHNLGSLHDRANSGGNQGAYPYSYGYQQPNGTTAQRFVTIMAYRNGCSGCPRVNYWSNPSVTYAGYPMGVDISQPNSADNRQTLNNTRTFAEQFRATVGTQPPNPSNNPPTVSSISPSAGSGTDAAFTAVFSDPNGASTISEAHVSMTTGTQASSACTVVYRTSTGALWLRDDSGSGWSGSAIPGSSTVMQNSQCRVSASTASVSASGNTLSVRFPVTLFGSFPGTTKDLQLRAIDAGGLDSGWQRLGSWTIPASVTQPPTSTTPSWPQLLSVSPASGQGNAVTLTAVANDANGASDVRTVSLIVNDRLATAQGCYILVTAATRSVSLLNNTASAWTGPATIGQATTLSNSQCTLDVSAMTLDLTGTRATVTYPLRFAAGFAGAKGVFGSVGDNTGRISAWVRLASFTVQ